MIEAVEKEPVIPVWFGKNQKGMQAKEELDAEGQGRAKQEWLLARIRAIDAVKYLRDLGLHKQIANRLLEPWMHITEIVSATDHRNFFKLRAHPDAQPEFQALAYKMKELYETNEPEKLQVGDWHLPFIYTEDWNAVAARGGDEPVIAIVKKISTARCARVSYVRQHERKAIEEDVALCERLAASGHWSPFEHVAQCMSGPERYGNFAGWKQYRKEYLDEHGGDQ